MRPSLALELHREAVRRIVERNDATNPRVFGSVARGEDSEASDLDLLVDPIDGRTTLISLVRIKRELEQTLGVRADVVTPNGLRDRVRQEVLADATAIYPGRFRSVCASSAIKLELLPIDLVLCDDYLDSTSS